MNNLGVCCKKYLGLKPFNKPGNSAKGNLAFYKEMEHVWTVERIKDMIIKLEKREYDANKE